MAPATWCRDSSAELNSPSSSACDPPETIFRGNAADSTGPTRLAQTLGIHTEHMWGRTGAMEKGGENVPRTTVAKRMQLARWGEPYAHGSPATLIDTSYRSCKFWNKGDAGGLSEYLFP